jgi:hypothetical protein
VLGLGALVVGFGLMAAAYRRFRYGEQYEYRQKKASGGKAGAGISDIISKVTEVEKWLDQLS